MVIHHCMLLQELAKSPLSRTLLTALLGKLPHSGKPKEALDEILVKNKQGNNFFHEALMNGHKDVMSILDSQEQKQIKGGFRELVVGAVLLWTNYKGVSVLHLAIWKGYGEIVDEALTILIRLTHQDSELFQLVNNNQDLASVILSAILAEKSSFRKENQEMLKDWENYRELGLLISRHFSPDKLKMEEKKKKEEGGEKKKEEEEKKKDGVKSDLIYLYDADMTMQRDRVRDRDGRYSQLASSDNHYVLHARSPLIVAILKQDEGILRKMLEKKKEWIHLKDSIGRTVFHHASYIGYLNGVEELLGNCTACSMEKDKYGYFPLHSASAGGHVEVIKKLLEYCPDPTEIVDIYGRNILHIATGKGKLSVRLTWAALKSAGAQYAKRESMEDPLPPQRVESYSRQESTNMDPYKDRINTLMLVAILITTVTFAAGFTLPGGTNSTESDPEQGMALMLHNVWFKLFIFCITISMYGSISVTVILIWAQLGDITLALFAFKMARLFLHLKWQGPF